MIEWRGKPLVIDHKRNVDSEIIECGIELEDIVEILERGKEVRKRAKGIIEKWLRIGRFIFIVAVEEFDDYWLVAHVGKIRATKKKMKLLGGEK